MIERIAPFVINNIIVRDHDDILKKASVSFDILMELQNLGVLSGVEALGLQIQYSSTDNSRYVRLLTSYGKGLLIENDDAKKKVDLQIYSITNLGRQAFELGKFSPNTDYLISVGRTIKKNGFKVSIVDYMDVGGGMACYLNAVEIKEVPQADTDQPGAPQESKSKGDENSNLESEAQPQQQ